MTRRFTLHDFTHEHEIRGNKLQNQKQGHFSLFRSLLSADWAKDPIKLAIWIRLLSDASFRSRSVEFRGKSWNLNPGELVTTTSVIASRVNDAKGSPIDKRLALRILKFFERNEMIQMRSDAYATVIFITNYCEYQEVERGTPLGTPCGTPHGTPHGTPKPSNGAGLRVVRGTPPGTPHGTPGGTPLRTQNNTDLNTDQKKISSSRRIKSGSSKGSRSSIRHDAAVQSPSGKFWGTSEDLRLAQWIFTYVSNIDTTAAEPNWSSWANDIRLLRQAKACDHRVMATTFKWANADGFWQTNVLSPAALRRHWETLHTRSMKVTQPNPSNHRDLDFDNSDWADGVEL